MTLDERIEAYYARIEGMVHTHSPDCLQAGCIIGELQEELERLRAIEIAHTADDLIARALREVFGDA